MKIILLSVMMVISVVQMVVAQKDSIDIRQLDEVVVSDSRFQLKREHSGKTVIKIDEIELQRNQGRTVAELINTKTGFEFNGSRSNAGQNVTGFVRGGNNRQVLVLIDGIAVSDPSNVNAEFDLRLLDISQIASIEIIKGAASTLYGNAAATAVINITTKGARIDGFRATLNSSAGTNQSQDEQNFDVVDFSNSITLGYRSGSFSVSGGLGNQSTNGLSAAIGDESDKFDRTNANFKLGYDFSKSFSTTFAFYYDDLNNAFDNGFPIEDADFNFESEQFRYALGSVYDYERGSFTFNAALNKIDRSFESDFPSTFDSQSIVLDMFNKYIIADKWHTVIGLNIVDHKTTFENEERATTTDPYLNVVYVSDFGLNLNVGGRLNNHSEYGTNLVYNLNPSFSFKMKEGYFKFLGSLATSFIAPNLSQLFGPFGPNPDLEPEENMTLEGGFEYRPNQRLRLSALYFDRTEENGIDFAIIDPDTFAGEFQNVLPKTNIYGVEFEVEAQLLSELKVVANYTHTDRSEGLALRIPKNKLNAQIDVQPSDKWLISGNYQYVSSRDDIDFSTFETVNLEAFGLVGLYTTYRLRDNFSAFITIENIFNEEYTEILNFTTRGRNVRIGFNMTF